MNSRKGLAIAGSLLSCVLLSLSAQAQYNATLTYEPTAFGGVGGYRSGDIQLQQGVTIGSDPLVLDVSLSQPLTLTSVGFGYNYGFGMGQFDPLVQPGGDAFLDSIELYYQGTLITPDFAYDLANPFTFGFDETNPFGFPVDNLEVETSTTQLAPTLTFDEVKIQVFNSNDGGESVGDFNFALGVTAPPPVPDTSSTLALLAGGVLAVFGLARRQATV